MNDTTPDAKTYEFRIRVLGNEVLAIGFSTNNDSNRFVFIGAATIALAILALVQSGPSLVSLYHALIK